MASIECAIELYDGVSPVLEAMTGTLDGFISRLEGLESGLVPDFQIDSAGLMEAASALEALAGGLSQVGAAVAVADNALSMGAGQAQALAMGLQLATAAFESLKIAGTASAAEMAVRFAWTTGQIEVSFLTMQAQVTAVLFGLENTAASVANSLPGYFEGPLASITAQFQAMAASARNSLASIASTASAAMSSVRSAAASISASASQAVSAVSGMQAVTTLSAEAVALDTSVQEVVVMAAETAEPELATLTQSVTLLPQELQENMLAGVTVVPQALQGAPLYAAEMLKEDLGTFAQERMPVLAGDDWGEPAFEGEVSFNEGTPERGRGETVFHVQVSNENHIGSEMDMETFFRAFEDRLLEALQSSAEGVY